PPLFRLRAGADEIAAARAPFRKVRHLVLCGLPEGGTEADAAARLLAGMDRLASVHVHVGTRPSGDADRADRAGRNGIGGGMPGGNAAGRDIPDRTHFAEAYALFRAKGAWPDEPEGFLHEVSARIGWPPQVVRVMRDVFEE